VEGAGVTFVHLARVLANPQTAHPLGGARMGADATTGVVDADGFVFGVEGLSVLDGAMVPSALGVNPSLTIAALVERAMANRLAALGRADAAELRPADVLAGRAPVAVRPRRPPSPAAPTAAPPGAAPVPATAARGPGRLPATGSSTPAGIAAVAAVAGALSARLARRGAAPAPADPPPTREDP
jgi:cholesterol oxidase